MNTDVKQELENLLQQEMSRKEFLQYVGSALLVFVGVGSLMKILKISPAQKNSTNSGYGSSQYGGVKR